MSLVSFHLREYSPGVRNQLSNKLSSRELEILRLVALGRKDREIGVGLFISEVGVKSHLQNIYKKLHALNRTDAVVKAHKQGYFDLMECK